MKYYVLINGLKHLICVIFFFFFLVLVGAGAWGVGWRRDYLPREIFVTSCLIFYKPVHFRKRAYCQKRIGIDTLNNLKISTEYSKNIITPSVLKWGLHQKGRICSKGERKFPLGVGPFSEMVKRSIAELSPLKVYNFLLTHLIRHPIKGTLANIVDV